MGAERRGTTNGEPAGKGPLSGRDPSEPELSAFGPARSTVKGAPLKPLELQRTHDLWSACNYLALGMIYLRDNPLLREPLEDGLPHVGERQARELRVEVRRRLVEFARADLGVEVHHLVRDLG